MKHWLARPLIRLRMRLTTRAAASRMIRRCLLDYRGLCAGVGDDEARQPVTVPPMLGVDPDMRNWSIFMILEHNVIVNRSITTIVTSLARGEEPAGLAVMDPKRDVMPSANPGPEQLTRFRDSVENHLRSVEGLPELRGTLTKLHPVFGRLDAHGWHCMFGLHLQIHLWQAEEIIRVMARESGLSRLASGIDRIEPDRNHP